MRAAQLAPVARIDRLRAVDIVAVKSAVAALPPIAVVFPRSLIGRAICLPGLRRLPGRKGKAR